MSSSHHARYEIAQRNKELLDKGCVILDFETTGLGGPDVEIIEIGIINHQGETLLNTLVKPDRPIPFAASNVNGIYDEDVQDAPSFLEIYPKLMRFLAQENVVAYNYKFEQSILGIVTGRYGLSIPIKKWHCSMRDYRNFRGLTHFTKLTKACASEGIVVENAHRALGDVVMTRELMKSMAKGVR